MSAVGQSMPTDPFDDLNAIITAINRMTIPPVKNALKIITESSLVQGTYSTSGRKKELNDRLIGHFVALKDRKMADQYRESKKILEKEYGTSISSAPYPTSTSRGWSYPGITAINPPTNAFSAGSYYVPQSNSNPYLAASSSTYTFPNASVSSSSSLSASNPFQPFRRPHYRHTPFLQIKDWVGPAVICSEAPNTQQRSAQSLKLQLTTANLELLRSSTAIHQLRLFCTTKTYFDAATNPLHPAPVEFPIQAEVRVNNLMLSVNLKGKKTAAKVLAPDINKDHALYFGGQDNKIDLLYYGTYQKYIMNVAICEIRHADTLARRIRRDKFRSKAEVLGQMKRAADDDDIEMGDVSMGLKCPLSYMRLNTPIRSGVCFHTQCFDALSFFSVNEQTPSWQCPICSKSIDPETLFLDGYVQDILEKVPEDEETILIDSEGRWHTPNGKYASDDPITNTEVSTLPEREEKEDTPRFNRSTVEANGALASHSALKAETPIPSPALSKPPPKKPTVEVVEIDDDDDESSEPEDRTVDSEKLQSVSETTLQSSPIATSALPNKLQQMTASSSFSGNGFHQANSRTSQSVDRRSSDEAAPQASQRSTTGQSAENSTSIVIDLTLSDSEEEEMPAPPRRRTSVTTNRICEQSSSAHPSSVTNSTNFLVRKSATPVIYQNGSQVKENGSSTGGSTRPSYNGWRPNSVNTNGNYTNPSTTPQVPARRSHSQIEEEEEGEEEGDKSQPVIAHRKRSRRGNAAVVDYEEEEENDEDPGWPIRQSSSENSDELYEEERAGLAVRH